MTRDEAIETIAPIIGRATSCSITQAHEAANVQVDVYTALGILKLDEPKSIKQQVLDVINRHVTCGQMQSIAGAINKSRLL